jgi:hypothetical protein
MTEPELICPCCGCGLESGWSYASCADYPRDERKEAHQKFCTNFADDICAECKEEIFE